MLFRSVLTSSETQSEITVTSVTWNGATNIKASIVLSTYVNAGFDYDLRAVMPDGQEYPSLFDRNGSAASNKSLTLRLNAPTITMVTDSDNGNNEPAPNAFVSGGVKLANNGTTNFSRAIKLIGTDFMNWTGLSTTIVPSTNTVKIRFQDSGGNLQPEISVSSLVYSGSTGLTAYLNISTAVAGGQYTLILTNPSSGTALSAASTFYVTVPTTSITSPLPGSNLGFTIVVGTVGMSFARFAATSSA